jgi:hypothetical protein
MDERAIVVKELRRAAPVVDDALDRRAVIPAKIFA